MADRDVELGGDLANGANAFRLIRVAAMREVEAGQVHASQNETLQNVSGIAGGPDGADNLRPATRVHSSPTIIQLGIGMVTSDH